MLSSGGVYQFSEAIQGVSQKMLNEHNLHVSGKKIGLQHHIFLLKTYIFGGKSVATFKSSNENLKENVIFNQIFIQVTSGNVAENFWQLCSRKIGN